jgi:hypothetical protein
MEIVVLTIVLELNLLLSQLLALFSALNNFTMGMPIKL